MTIRGNRKMPHQPSQSLFSRLAIQIMRISKKHSTKQERIFAEVLKDLHIPFKHRWIVHGREVDFLVGSYAIEIDGHEQDGEKNHKLAELGYIPIHLNNSEITKENIIKLIKNICH